MRDVNSDQSKVFNAVDHMLHREAQQASKVGRRPRYYSKPMIAEVRRNREKVSLDMTQLTVYRYSAC